MYLVQFGQVFLIALSVFLAVPSICSDVSPRLIKKARISQDDRPFGGVLRPETILKVRKDKLLDAVRWELVDEVRRLLSHRELRAVINERFKDSKTLLEIATNKSYREIVRLLIAHGADVHMRLYGSDSLLHRAADNADEVLINLLLDLGVDIYARNCSRESPLSSLLVEYSTRCSGVVGAVDVIDGHTVIDDNSVLEKFEAAALLLVQRGVIIRPEDIESLHYLKKQSFLSALAQAEKARRKLIDELLGKHGMSEQLCKLIQRRFLVSSSFW